MAIHRYGVFENQTIVVDGEEYEHCSFKKCSFVYRGGIPPRIDQCLFLGTDWKLEDAAARTILFLGFLREVGGGAFVDDILSSLMSIQELPDGPVQ